MITKEQLLGSGNLDEALECGLTAIYERDQAIREKGAYREVAKEFRKDLFDRMRIPYDHDPEIYTEVDAEARRIMEEGKDLPK